MRNFSKNRLDVVLYACIAVFIFISVAFRGQEKKPSLVGSWKLISGTTISGKDTVRTDYTQGKSFVKIINATHFAFLQHDLEKGKGKEASYSSGGGTYSLQGNQYTEHLEYCSDRQWEGNDFSFTVSLKNDTLIQTGREKVEAAGIDRINEERYIRSAK